jgi:hypothetical protein
MYYLYWIYVWTICLSGFAQKMGSAAGCTARPKRTEAGREAFSVRGPTQTDRFGRFGYPKWVGPLEMPYTYRCLTCQSQGTLKTMSSAPSITSNEHEENFKEVTKLVTLPMGFAITFNLLPVLFGSFFAMFTSLFSLYLGLFYTVLYINCALLMPSYNTKKCMCVCVCI